MDKRLIVLVGTAITLGLTALPSWSHAPNMGGHNNSYKQSKEESSPAIFNCTPTETTKKRGDSLISVTLPATVVFYSIEDKYKNTRNKRQTIVYWIDDHLPEPSQAWQLCNKVANSLQSYYNSGQLEDFRVASGKIDGNWVVCLTKNPPLNGDSRNGCSSRDPQLFHFLSGDESPREAFKKIVPYARGSFVTPQRNFWWLFQ